MTGTWVRHCTPDERLRQSRSTRQHLSDSPLAIEGTEPCEPSPESTATSIGDLLGPDRESLYLEYKSTLRWDVNAQRKGGVTEDAAVKTIAGFANSRFGGTLLIGVADDGSVHGLEDDYDTFTERGERGDQDLWGQHLQNLIRSRLGDAALDLTDWEFHTVDGKQLARISIEPSGHPINERKGDQEVFWNRTPTSTLAITDPAERDKIIARRWGRGAAPPAHASR